MPTLYYTAPSDEIFEEVKKCAIEVWGAYDDTYGYATEKIVRIKDISNIGDNMMFIVAMFDVLNQRKLADLLSLEAYQAITERVISGGDNFNAIWHD